MQLKHLDRHDRPILASRVMRKSKDTPQDKILIQHIIAPISCVGYTPDFKLGLQSVPATRVKFVVLVLCNPHVALCEECAFGLHAVGVGKQELSGWWCDFVADRLSRYGVSFVKVLHLEDPVVERGCVETLRCGDLFLANLIQVTIGVCPLIHPQRETLFLDDSVLCAINRRIYSDTEDVLMVLRKCARANDVAPVAGLARVNVDNGDNSCCAGFYDNTRCLVELVVEDVLVVGEGDDELDNQLASAGNNGSASAPIGVLPADTVVLLMETDCVLCIQGCSI
ncbi:hypothetical protein HG531_007057 [Fusarium graminearum]|nr:hypothetical protein HG531_007057 [Fusarium graminearum]